MAVGSFVGPSDGGETGPESLSLGGADASWSPASSGAPASGVELPEGLGPVDGLLDPEEDPLVLGDPLLGDPLEVAPASIAPSVAPDELPDWATGVAPPPVVASDAQPTAPSVASPPMTSNA
jgi:hypothetical protein